MHQNVFVNNAQLPTLYKVLTENSIELLI